jgi:hypothetical protein
MKYLVALALLIFSFAANAGNVTITWTFDSTSAATCADGSPAAANCPVDSFRVEQQVNSIWTAKSPNLSGAVRNHTYANISAGRQCFRIRASSNGTLSDPSNEVCVDVAPTAPKAPIITVTVAVGSPAQ